MPKRSSKDRNSGVTTRQVVERAIGDHFDGDSLLTEGSGKNPAAVALGRLGGMKGGKARAKKLSKQERHRIAVMAAKARWQRK